MGSPDAYVEALRIAILEGRIKDALDTFHRHKDAILAHNSAVAAECSARLLDRDSRHIIQIGLLVKRLEDRRQPLVSDQARLKLAKGIVLFHREDFSNAVETLKLACSFADACAQDASADDLDLLATTRFYLARAHHRRGELQAGLDAAEQGAGVMPPNRAVAQCHLAQAWILVMQGQIEQAKRRVEEAEKTLGSHSDYIDKCNILALSARILRYGGPPQYKEAENKLHKAILTCESREYIGLARCYAHLGLVLLLQAKQHAHGAPRFKELKTEAETAFNSAQSLCHNRHGRSRVRARIHYFRARWHLELGEGKDGELGQARREAKLAQQTAQAIKDSTLAAHALITQSIIERKYHRPHCKQLAEEALKEETDNRRAKARAQIALAMALLQPDTYDYHRACELKDQAADLLRTSDQDYLREEFDELERLLRDPPKAKKLVIPLGDFFKGEPPERMSRLTFTLRQVEKLVVKELSRDDNITDLAKDLGTDTRRLNDALDDLAIPMPEGWLRWE